MDAPAVDATRVIADLRELQARTGNENGAQRLCWGEEWRGAQAFLGELLAEIGLEPERDAAGNLWAFLEGERGPALAIGSHLDSVPDGGWLDGAYGVMAGLGVLRAWAQARQRPPRTLALVDFADEEGARFGRSLFGSSAFAGTLDGTELETLTDAEDRSMAEVLAENGVELARVGEAAVGRQRIGEYLELHIEQGPVLANAGLQAAAVTGCAGVERLRFVFGGQAAHAGTTPMDMRHDAGLAAARAALEIEQIPSEHGGVATTGELELRPGISTAIAGEATLSVDLRHPDQAALEQMLAAARHGAQVAASSRGCTLKERFVWRIAPIAFDARLVDLAAGAIAARTTADTRIASGALHDAAELARVLPAAMVFCPSLGGISHARQEDTEEADLAVGIEVFAALAAKVMSK